MICPTVPSGFAEVEPLGAKILHPFVAAWPPAQSVVVFPANACIVALTKLKFARFNRLKNSARNCTLPFSPRKPTFVSFTTEKSHVAKPGLRKMERGASPGKPSEGTPNINGLNQWLGSPVITVFGSYGIQL